MIELRAHHMLCLLTYVGKGYSDSFCRNFSALLEAIGRGEPVLIAAGFDDVCNVALKPGEKSCRTDCRAARRDGPALDALNGNLSLDPPLRVGGAARLTADDVAQMRKAFARGAFRQACAGCAWGDLCAGIAAGGFEGVVLYPEISGLRLKTP